METAYSRDFGREQVERGIITAVYGWMTGGLALTGLIAFIVASNETWQNAASRLRLPVVILVFALVIGMSALINRISAATAAIMFITFSAAMGLMLSSLFLIYTKESMASTFFVTSGTFGAMCVYGFTTKRDLSGIGSLCLMGLIGIIIASIVNSIFIGSPDIYWAVTYLGVLVFVGLTAYDTQKIKKMAREVGDNNSELAGKIAVIGALTLYLDFINLFILLLRIMGRRK